MDRFKMALFSEIRGIMMGKNAPERSPIGKSVVMLRSGKLFMNMQSISDERGRELFDTSELRDALSALKSRQVAQAEKRMRHLQERKEADLELIRLLADNDDEQKIMRLLKDGGDD